MCFIIAFVLVGKYELCICPSPCEKFAFPELKVFVMKRGRQNCLRLSLLCDGMSGLEAADVSHCLLGRFVSRV
jgi:hypothetical protein